LTPKGHGGVKGQLTGGCHGGVTSAGGHEGWEQILEFLHDPRSITEAQTHWNGDGVEPKGELTEWGKSTATRRRCGDAPVDGRWSRSPLQLLRGKEVLLDLSGEKKGGQ
jgi:hypothetical protein